MGLDEETWHTEYIRGQALRSLEAIVHLTGIIHIVEVARQLFIGCER